MEVYLLVFTDGWNKASLWVQNGLYSSLLLLFLCSPLFLHLSSCHHFILPLLPPSSPLCRLSRRQRGSRPPQLNEWFNRERERKRERERLTLTPQKMKEGRERRLGGREGGNRWQKGRGGIGRESVTTSELKGRERVSCHFPVCRLQRVIQLNNVWLFSVPTTNQPDRKRQRCNRYFNPFFFHSTSARCIKWSVWTLPGAFSFFRRNFPVVY